MTFSWDKICGHTAVEMAAERATDAERAAEREKRRQCAQTCAGSGCATRRPTLTRASTAAARGSCCFPVSIKKTLCTVRDVLYRGGPKPVWG